MVWTNHRMPTLLALAVTAGGLIGLPGCGSSKPAAKPVDTLAPPIHSSKSAVTIEAIDNDFTPKNLVIKPGTKVTFDDVGHNAHDITPDNPGHLDFTVTSDQFHTGSKVSFTFTQPGTYPYYCSLHASATAGSMRGFITVEAPTNSSGGTP